MAVEMVEVYRHAIGDGDEFITDSPDPCSTTARRFEPWSSAYESSIWIEVGDESRKSWAYIPTYSCMVPWEERDKL